MEHALVLDDNAQRAEITRTILEFLEYRPELVSGATALARLGERIGKFDFAVLTVGPDSGFAEEALSVVKANSEHFPIVVVAADAVDAKRLEALQPATSGLVNFPLRLPQFQHALQQVQLYRDNRHLGGTIRSIELFRNLVGGSERIRKVRKLIEQVATTDATVLLLGESGTGKEVVARNIHYHSSRRYKPFIPVNCGAIPSELLESELFGHEKGAFTGAISARSGRFEMALGGTLFLDEIGDMPLAMQVKLLRVLQEKTFERVGGNKSLNADVRIIAATHNDLENGIQTGAFREDLYYRLNVFPVQVPPLRERTDDLPMLVSDLISRMENEKRGSIRLTHHAMISLQHYSWPGNVRELANLIERLVILYPYGIVDRHDLPDKYQVERGLHEMEPAADLQLSNLVVANQSLPREGLDLKQHLTNLEAQLISQALEDADGVVAHAAKRLKMGRTTLVEKMRKLGIHRPASSV